MPQLNTPYYRRDYKGEPISYVENGENKSLYVRSRYFAFDRNVDSSIVIGNGISRLQPDIQLILRQNANRVAEGYKTTYACNAAYRDVQADYFIIKDRIFFSELTADRYNQLFVSNDMWVTYRDTNLIPYIYYMDSGSSAAYLAAFDGAKKVFLFGFDSGDSEVNNNVYQNTLGYTDNKHLYTTHSAYLSQVCKVYKDVDFYRIRTQYSYDFGQDLVIQPNYHEISVRDAVLLGDF